MVAFIIPSGSHALQLRRTNRVLCPNFYNAARPCQNRVPIAMKRRSSSQKVSWLQLGLFATSSIAGSVAGAFQRQPDLSLTLTPPPVHAATVDLLQQKPSDLIHLEALGVKRDEYVSDRELRRRKTTQLSEAEQEIMELEEYEYQTQWFRNFQALWACLASVGGIFLLYKGGVMWENWIKEQERKDMEEEIKLTGTFIDPRAVRKDENKADGKKKKNPKSDGPSAGPAASPSDPKSDPSGGDMPPGDADSLEKLFGKT